MKDLDPMKVIKLAGSRKALAGLLGIGRSAISQWRGTVPEQRAWQLRALKPEWFDAQGALWPLESGGRRKGGLVQSSQTGSLEPPKPGAQP